MSRPSIFLTLLACYIQGSAGYTLPQNAIYPLLRASAINVTRAGFLYGDAVAGGPFYPTGSLGLAKVSADVAAEESEALPEQALVDSDVTTASASTSQSLDTVEDYLSLYDGEWTQILPKGPVPGVLTNYSQDLFFSMERLANSPFSVRRLGSGSLPFDVEDSVAQTVAGASLQQLLDAGRLFYADHSDHANLPPSSGKYGAACDAYFFIDEVSGDFLPLAIRTGVGANLIYTPADSASDWLLAKIMYNVNDFLFAQVYHLAATHEVIQIAWMAAIRTLSVEHPLYGLLDRLTYQLFATQPLANSYLFDNGTAFDRVFAVSGSGARDYNSQLYFSGSGAFQANYFLSDLQNRGLINSTGPELTHFPYYEDATVIHNAIRAFMTSFVESFYASDAVVLADTELQAWVAEANGPAEAIDFPSEIATTETIIDILTHVAHLASTVHHTINTNELISLSSTLPMHPSALYKPVPTAKGNTSVASFLPPPEAVLAQFEVEGLFARPLLANTNRSLLNMFNNVTFLAGTNAQTRAAAETFKSTMQTFSEQVQARTFDEDGLSQGMPFLWQALDPNVAPYSLTI